MKTALSIAGSDSSAGAGIQADIKAMTMNGVYATTAITALTAQNTTGVRAIMEVTPQFLAQQIDAVFEDIRPDAVKIGMVSSPELVNTIAERLHFYHAQNIVVDPVVVATSGSVLACSKAFFCLWRRSSPQTFPKHSCFRESKSTPLSRCSRLPASSARNVGAQSCAKAVTASATQMTCCMPTEKPPGFTASASKIPTPTAPAAPFPAPLPPTLLWERI